MTFRSSGSPLGVPFSCVTAQERPMPSETRGRLRPSSLAKIEKLVRRARTSMHCRSRNGNAWPQEASFGSGRRDRGSSHEASISPRHLAKAGPGNRPNPGKKGEGVSDKMAFFEWIARCKLVISFEGSHRVQPGCRSAHESKHGYFQELVA